MSPPSRSLGHRAPLLWLVLPFMAGLALGRTAPMGSPGWQLGAAATFAALGILAHLRMPRLWPFTITAALTLAGHAMYVIERARLDPWDRLPVREARLTIRVDRLFTLSDPSKVSGLATTIGCPPHLRDLAGQRLYFSLALPPGNPPPLRSAVISTIGVLETLPRRPPDDSFDGYLASAGMNFRLTRGRILGLEHPPSGYYRFCAAAATRFSAILADGVAAKRPELAAILRAMLLGQKHELSDEQDSLFMQSGTMHLFAISGLHIGMIAVALFAILRLLRLPPILSLVLGLGGLWLYVDITGGAPSAVRAFIMVALVETALVMRLPRNPIAALAASALVVVLGWPMQIFSASFQLSYGIVAALLLLGLPLGEAWERRSRWFSDLPVAAWTWIHRCVDATRRKLISAVAIGIASTLVSTIAGILYFKLFTPGALFANLLLIPASMLVILGGFASLLCGLLGLQPWSVLFNHAAVMILWVIDVAVRRAVAIPGAWQPARFSDPGHGQIALTLLILTLLLGYAGNWHSSRGGWWPPFAVVAITLLVAVDFN